MGNPKDDPADCRAYVSRGSSDASSSNPFVCGMLEAANVLDGTGGPLIAPMADVLAMYEAQVRDGQTVWTAKAAEPKEPAAPFMTGLMNGLHKARPDLAEIPTFEQRRKGIQPTADDMTFEGEFTPLKSSEAPF